LRTTNEDLVSFRKGLAPAAGASWRLQEQLVELVALYIVLFLLFPDAMILITGLFVLAIASAF
jgi:hypothetical protein